MASLATPAAITVLCVEVCEVVPDVDCVNVLKKVPELQCTPEVSRECNDVEKKVPYLEEAEDCVQVTFDECQEVRIHCRMGAHSTEF